MGGEERAKCACMCESAGLFSVVSPLPARCSPSVSSRCVRGREGAGESLLALSLSSLSHPAPPPLLSLFVCVCVCVCGCWGRGARRGGGGRGGGAGRGGEEARGRGHPPMIGCELHGEQEAHAAALPAQILSAAAPPRFLARPPLPPAALPPRRLGLRRQHTGLLIIFLCCRR